MAEEKVYEVILAGPALKRYQKTILSYLVRHYSAQRVSEIDQQLIRESKSLSRLPSRGRREEYLTDLEEDFRYILYAPSKGLEIKVIYYIEEQPRKVYITDFFPTRMSPDNIMNE